VLKLRELVEVKNTCYLYNFRLFAIFMPKLGLSVLVEIYYDKNKFA